MSKKITKFSLNRENPFLEDTYNHVEKGEKIVMLTGRKNEIVIDTDTGETKGHSVFMKRIKIDKAKFAKIYLSNLDYFFDLSKTGLKMFGYIATVIKPNNDSFVLDYVHCMEQTGYKSRKSIFNGLAELMENKFIARGHSSIVYFINPTVFFNGDRVTFLRTYEIENEKIQGNSQDKQGQIRQVQRKQSDEI